MRRSQATARLGSLCALTLTLACASTSPNTRATSTSADPDPNRSVDTSGGHVTFGFRVTPGADEQHVHVVGVLVGLDGQEHITDLGDWQGELTVADREAGELVHLHLEGPEPHEFTAVPVGDTDLDLLIDGVRVERVHADTADRIRANQPLILREPSLRVDPER